MTALSELPRPGEQLDSTADGFRVTVVASVWVDDDALTALLLVLRPYSPHFEVANVVFDGGGWDWVSSEIFHNIVPAVDCYQSQGGDY